MQKNKLISVSLICFMILFIFTGCNNKDEIINLEDSKPIQENIISEDTLKETEKNIIIVSADWAPYEFVENGQIKGISVDIVNEVFNRMGYKVTNKVLPFSRAIEMLEKGEVDMILDVKNTVARQEIGIFSKEPIITTSTSLFVKNNSNIEFDGYILDLKPYKIGIVRDYSYGEEFDTYIKNNILKTEVVDDNMQNVNKVLDERLDICIENRLVMLNELRATNNEHKLKELKPEIHETPVYGWFTKKKNLRQMIEEFDKKLVEVKQDGTFEKIYNSYVK